MKKEPLTISVKLDERTFRRFGVFDTLIRRQHLLRPLAFAAVFLFAGLLVALSGNNGARLLAVVLYLAGIGLPLNYIRTFLSQLNRQAELQKLGDGRYVYTVVLSAEEIRFRSEGKEETQSLPYRRAHAAYRKKDCIYLYVTPERAFLLPAASEGPSQEEIWALLQKKMGDRCHG